MGFGGAAWRCWWDVLRVGGLVADLKRHLGSFSKFGRPLARSRGDPGATERAASEVAAHRRGGDGAGRWAAGSFGVGNFRLGKPGFRDMKCENLLVQLEEARNFNQAPPEADDL